MGKKASLVRWLRGGAAALALVAVTGWSGQSGLTHFGSAALAADEASSLTPDQVAAIQNAVQTALVDVDPSLTGNARAQAIAQALTQATTSAISLYGAAAISVVTSSAITDGIPVAQVVAAVLPAAASIPGVATATAVADVVLGAISAGASASLVTEAVILTASQSGLASSDVGTGLGAAAVEVAETNPDAANAIGQAVSNEGTSDMGQAFASSVIANGGSQQLASTGTQAPNATNETNGNNGQQSNNQQNSNGQTTTPPPCSNPSCT